MRRNLGVFAASEKLPVIFRSSKNTLSISPLAPFPLYRSLGVGVGIGIGLGIGEEQRKKKDVLARDFDDEEEQTDGRQRPEIRGGSTSRMPLCGAYPHPLKHLRRATVRLGFFRFSAVKEFTSMYGYDGEGKRG